MGAEDLFEMLPQTRGNRMRAPWLRPCDRDFESMAMIGIHAGLLGFRRLRENATRGGGPSDGSERRFRVAGIGESQG